jgi:ABC-type Fe3+/spermidine/putrescine transport system ATPase subunit
MAVEPTTSSDRSGTATIGGSASPVSLINVTKEFAGGTRAVGNLSLHMESGEIYTLLGPSGCGKTTTLRMIAGLEEPTAGQVLFGDHTVVNVDQHIFVRANKREVGMVFQSYAIWPHMTVEENVGYPLKLRGVPNKEVRDRVSSALDLVGMPGLEKRPAPLLSGGQQQRVALARAIVYEPGVLLLDEPFSNLDAKLRDQMRIEVKLLQQRLKVTVVFVTHDQVEALSLSDRIAVMNLGKVQQVGIPQELYEHPANPFVRDFLGKTVLLKGVVQSANSDGQVAVQVEISPSCTLFGHLYDAQKANPGQAVFIAIRPEDIELSPAREGETPTGMVRGTVEARLFVGERTEYRVQVEGQGSLLVYGRRDQILEPGHGVYLRPHSQNVGIWPA